MANNVSDISVKLSTDPQRFIKGFEDARKSVQPLASAVNNLNSSLTSFNFGGFSSRFASLVQPLQGLAANALARNIPGMAIDAVNLASALASIGSESLRAAANQIRTSDQLGTTQEGFQGLTILARRAGLEIEDVTGLVGKFNSRIGEMRQGLARGELPELSLTLRRLGIDAREFAQQNTSQQLYQVAQALERLPNAQDRRFTLGQFFGEREANTAQRLFRYGPQSLIDAENQAIERGLVLRGEERRRVEAVATAQRELNAQIEITWNAIGREIGLRTAPAATFATNVLRGGTLESRVVSQFFNAATFQRGGPAIPSHPMFAEQLSAINDEMLRAEAAKEMLRQIETASQQVNHQDELRNNLDRQAVEYGQNLLHVMERQRDTLGMSAANAEIYRRNLDEINPVLAQQLRQMELESEIIQRQIQQANQLRQAHRASQPVEVFRASIRDAFNNPRLNADERRFNALQSIRELEAAIPKLQYRYAGANQLGSVEAFSAITQARAEQIPDMLSAQQRVENLLQRGLTYQQRQTELAQAFVDALERNGIAVAPEVR